MDLLEAAILGIVQGATEYLPVSSSGHLVLAPNLLGWKKAPFVFDVLVQLGTLLGLFVYYWRELWDVAAAMVRGVLEKKPFGTKEAVYGWMVGLATIPAGAAGLLVEDYVEDAFSSVRAAMGFLLLTALLLVLGERFGTRKRTGDNITAKDAVVIGVFQALALFPGVSRSGSTIAAGMLLGIDRPGAARFSFLMSIPVMVGAGLLQGRKLIADPTLLEQHGLAIVVGFITAAISGYLVIKWFLGFLRVRSLYWFAGYCFIVGTLGLLFLG
jgi:undecaprenyl-diphosphatase